MALCCTGQVMRLHGTTAWRMSHASSSEYVITDHMQLLVFKVLMFNYSIVLSVRYGVDGNVVDGRWRWAFIDFPIIQIWRACVSLPRGCGATSSVQQDRATMSRGHN